MKRRKEVLIMDLVIAAVFTAMGLVFLFGTVAFFRLAWLAYR